MVQRSMQLQCTIQDGEIWVSGDGRTVTVNLLVRQ
jgi:uncharacterized protein YaeQ